MSVELAYLWFKQIEMNIDLVGLVVAVFMVIGIWVKLETALKAIQTRQDGMDKEIDYMKSMIERQLIAEKEIKEFLSDLRVGQENLHGKIDVLSTRIGHKS